MNTFLSRYPRDIQSMIQVSERAAKYRASESHRPDSGSVVNCAVGDVVFSVATFLNLSKRYQRWCAASVSSSITTFPRIVPYVLCTAIRFRMSPKTASTSLSTLEQQATAVLLTSIFLPMDSCQQMFLFSASCFVPFVYLTVKSVPPTKQASSTQPNLRPEFSNHAEVSRIFSTLSFFSCE